ncbi:MAG: pseudaminic acid synthase [Prosthecobacter sp.]|nr:pseudaminic acid synthase [Prosthecobacter sp.]
MNIAGVPIGLNHRPFIIAELSGNHNGSLDRALSLVDAAAATGVQCLKLQTYTADTLTLDIRDKEFVISDPKSIWKGRSLHDLYQEAHTPWEWHAPIIQRAQELGLVCFSSPFDESAVDFLETLNVPAYKIGSFECTHLPLLKKVAATGRPVILSTGMATVAEIDEAVRTLRGNGCSDLALLKCTSTYPSTPENSNLRTLPHLREMFGCEVGLSDHTLGIGVSVGAVALGAVIIEKHFTLARADGGVDSTFSMEPEEMKALAVETERAWQGLGRIHYGPSSAEKIAASRRRSIYFSQDVEAGQCLSVKNLRIVRPGLGLEPKFLDLVLGRRISVAVTKGTPLTWDMLLDD